MVKILKIFQLMLISTIMILYQPGSTVVANDSKLKLATNDTIVYLNIPARLEDAIGGFEFADQITGLSLKEREKAIVREILAGNVPSFSRKLRQLKINRTIGANNYELIFYTVCDYMAIGSDQDYLYIPMTPSTAQYLADRMDCSLPTKKMVDIIYAGAEIKLAPQPIPPSDKMTTVPVFRHHTDSIKQQISQIGFDRSANNIIAGHKKDIIISNKIYSTDRNYDRVVIYGWHLSNYNPIQPVYNGHIASYADYSHGVRLISNVVFINGDSAQVTDILQDPNLAFLLSSEGIISKPYYPESDIFSSMGSRSKNFPIDFKLSQNYPNPFNSSTAICYSTRHDGLVQLKIYDISGRLVITLVNEEQPAGTYRHIWQGQTQAAKPVSSGIFFCNLSIQTKSASSTQSQKLILIR